MNAVTKDAKQFPLKLTLTAMNERTRAAIEYYVERSKNQYFAIAQSADTPDVIIIDHDYPGTADRLASLSWQSDIPIVVMAVGDTKVNGAIMVRKPLDSASLVMAAQKALAQLNQKKELPAQTPGNEPEQGNLVDALRADVGGKQTLPKLTRKPARSAHASRSSTPTYFRTSDAALPGASSLSTSRKIQRYSAKIELLCGPSRTLEDLSDPQNSEHRFDPARSLSNRVAGVAFDTASTVKAVQFELPDANIFVLPTLDKVYCSLSLEYKRHVKSLFRDWDESEIAVHSFDNATVNQVVDRVNRSERFSFGLESFCWLSALFSTQGRLPVGFDINTECRLIHWPNITRLELIPDCLEIAAAWSDKTATVRQIVDAVRCEPRHVVSFFNAANTIKLMDLKQ